MNQDAEHLRILSVFHYVMAGISLLGALFPVIHLLVGMNILTAVAPDAEAPDPRLIGGFLVAFAALWILCGLAYVIALILAGRYLAEQRRYTFCLVVAGISCIFVPFGTVLGVFTILVLTRSSVKARFGPVPGPERA